MHEPHYINDQIGLDILYNVPDNNQRSRDELNIYIFQPELFHIFSTLQFRWNVCHFCILKRISFLLSPLPLVIEWGSVGKAGKLELHSSVPIHSTVEMSHNIFLTAPPAVNCCKFIHANETCCGLFLHQVPFNLRKTINYKATKHIHVKFPH